MALIPPHYTVTDVGTLPGYTATTFDAPAGQIFNNAGQIIVRCSRVADPGDCAALQPGKTQYTAARFTPGLGLQDISAGATELSLTPVAIDSTGHVFGFATDFTWTQQAGPGSCSFKVSPTSGRVWEYSDPGVVATFTASPFVNQYAVRGGLHNLNDHGMAVLNAFDLSTFTRASGRFVGSVWQDCSALDPRLTSSSTFLGDINQNDQICGSVPGPNGFAFRFSDAKGLEILPDISTLHSTSAIAMNNNGDIAATFGISGQTHAAFYRNGQPGIDIHNSELAPQSNAQYIGGPYVSGYLLGSNGSTTSIYRWDLLRGMVQIPLDAAVQLFGIFGMNNAGTVIGDQVTILDPRKPWMWSPRTGTVYLRDAIGDPDEQSWQLLDAIAINDRGQIAVSAFNTPASGRPSILILTPDNICAADFDQSSVVNVSDIFAFLRAWFAKNPDADFDNSGAINVSDIFAFLRAWFAKCH